MISSMDGGHARRLVKRVAALFVVAASAGGCTAIVNTGAGELAGIAGAAIADAVTSNAGVAAGIGLGMQAGARAGVQYAQRRVQDAAQDRIAQAAGPLAVGDIAPWRIERKPPLADAQAGRVTVSRVLALASLECKEIVFSVEQDREEAPRDAFYVAMVCREGGSWKWASAEPATARWGGLQ